MKTCNIYLTTKDGQLLIGKITLDGTLLTVTSIAGKGTDMPSFLTDSHYVNGKMITSKQDPKAWFEALPRTYSGSYLRAEMVA